MRGLSWFEPNEGVVDRIIEQGRLWRVKYQGSIWFARPFQPDTRVTAHPGEMVKIMGIAGNSLLVASEQPS